MKAKHLLTSSLLFSSTLLFSQTFLTVKVPAIGDSTVFGNKTITSTADIPNVGLAGTGQNWDFTSYGESPNLASSKWFAPSVFEESVKFPNANIASNTRSLSSNAVSGSSFGVRSATKLDIVGNVYYTSPQVVVAYTDPLSQMPSLAFNGTAVDYASSIGYSAGQAYYTAKDTATYKYDAVGTLKYVYGTFSNVARISYQVRTYQDLGYGYTVAVSNNYGFYDLDLGQALFAYTNLQSDTYISSMKVLSNSTKTVYIYKPYELTAIGDEKMELSKLIAFPNPVQDKLFLSNTNLQIATDALILDAKGEEIARLQISGNQLDVSELQNGLYFAEIKTANSVKRLKFIVSR